MNVCLCVRGRFPAFERPVFSLCSRGFCPQPISSYCILCGGFHVVRSAWDRRGERDEHGARVGARMFALYAFLPDEAESAQVIDRSQENELNVSPSFRNMKARYTHVGERKHLLSYKVIKVIFDLSQLESPTSFLLRIIKVLRLSRATV